MRLLLMSLLATSAFGQSAISSLTSFWEMNIDGNDGIAWDYKGSAHARWVSKKAQLQLPGTIFGSGFYRSVDQAWSSGTSYVTGDMVLYSGATYQAEQASTAQQPDISPTYWTHITRSGSMTVSGGLVDTGTGSFAYAFWVRAS